MIRVSIRRVTTYGAGFTLVELLVATFVVAVTLAATYHVFQTCLEVQARGDADMSAVSAARLFCAQLGRELRCAATFDGVDAQFVGTADMIAFTSMLPLVTLGEKPAPCLRICYHFVMPQSEGEAGNVERTQALAAGGTLLKEPEESERILANVRQFAFSYLDADNSEWTDSWEKQNVPPASVRLRMALSGMPSDEVLTVRTIFEIPAGARQAGMDLE